MNKKIIKADLANLNILFDAHLSNYTYTKTGGPADVLVFPKNRLEVKQVVDYCQQHDYPWLCLGNASNLIVKDGGIEGFVIMLSDMANVSVKGTQLTAESGAKLIDVTHVALTEGLTGMAFACGIPGSIGGAAYMNAGAYGGELADIFASCDVLMPDGQFKTLDQKDMRFSYRHSELQQNRAIVLSVTFNLVSGDYQIIEAEMKRLTDLRESKQPLELPSCGSVFKRPEGHFTGQLIQEAGLQGLIWGGAQVSMKHAGFIVNLGQATATDYIELIEHIKTVILERFNVALETEVRIIGRD